MTIYIFEGSNKNGIQSKVFTIDENSLNSIFDTYPLANPLSVSHNVETGTYVLRLKLQYLISTEMKFSTHIPQ